MAARICHLSSVPAAAGSFCSQLHHLFLPSAGSGIGYWLSLPDFARRIHICNSQTPWTTSDKLSGKPGGIQPGLQFYRKVKKIWQT